uniref:Uncharacterized protein n=1 Tax=Bombyx mori TaxID=7091 RepID=A0A8R2HMM9_BOMMO|nr:uncharacterized protein LOC110385160 [Bombyx mori]
MNGIDRVRSAEVAGPVAVCGGYRSALSMARIKSPDFALYWGWWGEHVGGEPAKTSCRSTANVKTSHETEPMKKQRGKSETLSVEHISPITLPLGMPDRRSSAPRPPALSVGRLSGARLDGAD